MVMVHDPVGQGFQRFDFAERNAPRWLYLGKTEALLVFPPGGRRETEHRYLIHRFVEGDKQGGIEEIDRVRPDTEGYEVIELGALVRASPRWIKGASFERHPIVRAPMVRLVHPATTLQEMESPFPSIFIRAWHL
ncbi:hypothetical protein CLU95_0855 [Variovorax sp. 54]|uniref:hypothetical protein n=1 Tax=Variovorax sp. 54 TaxID=2035212 RepID=UPI000C1A61AE|nr:hypothetical protein [Variovorax sp. 54]PIF73754.1 hypothetical protein CLU95_0855 [Variovorax sp. 54]